MAFYKKNIKIIGFQNTTNFNIMIEISNIIRSANKYNFNSLEKQLNELQTYDLKFIPKKINYHVNLVNQRSTEKSAKINDFKTSLEKYFKDKEVETNIFLNIKIIESLYKQILEDRINILREYKSHEILNSQFYLVNQLYQRILEHAKTLIKPIDGDNLHYFESLINKKSEYFDGDDIDKHVEEISKVFYMNLIIASYENNWFNQKSKEVLIPFEILSQEDNEEEYIKKINISKELILNSGLWDITEDLDFRLRFFEDEVIIENNKIYHKNEIWRKLGDYALIAKTRQQRMMAQKIFEAGATFYRAGIKDKNKLEYLTIAAQFEDLYYIDIEKDNDLYKSLTIKEWINALLAFKEIATNTGFSLIKYEDLFKVLLKYNIPISKNIIVLENFLFRSTSKDLYNNPILKFSNNSILIFPLTMLYPEVITVINSIFADNNLVLKDKGYDFEDYVFNFLNEKKSDINNFNITQPKFKNHDGEFQYDAIMEWDDYIFIIECKNRSIPNTTAMSIKDFQEKSNEYINQISRLKRGLISYPKEHNIDLKDKTIVPILLNSLPFSLDYATSGIYFLDFSCFSKFFTSQDMHLQSAYQGEIKNEQLVHKNWSSDKPSVQDFLRFINNPFQVDQLKSCIKVHSTTHEIGNYEITLDRRYIDFNLQQFGV